MNNKVTRSAQKRSQEQDVQHPTQCNVGCAQGWRAGVQFLRPA